MKTRMKSQRKEAEVAALMMSDSGQMLDMKSAHEQKRERAPEAPPAFSSPEAARYGHQFGQTSVFPPTSGQAATGAIQCQASDASATQNAGSVGSVSLRAPIQRDGQDLPGGAQIETVNKDTSAVTSAIRRIANNKAADNADFESRVGPRLGPAANTMTTVNFDFIETNGLNMQWTGSVRFRLGTPRKVEGGGAADAKRSGGTSVSTSNQVNTGSKDSGSVTGGASKGEKDVNGTSGSATLGTENSRGDQDTNTGTSSTGVEASMRNQFERYEATLIAEITVQGAPDFSGSDYINPFKWGFASVGGAMSDRQNGSVECGSISYYVSNGMAPGGSAPGTGAVQKQSRMESALGITDSAKANFQQTLAAQSTDPAVQMSRAGATPLPSPVAAAAEQHHSTSMSSVRLVHGSQADSYCDSMSANAFTTPNNEGGSDIFMHSNIPLNSAQGQHTLQHEVAHTAQQKKGETNGLNGLGGDASRRHALEHDADRAASAILSKPHHLDKPDQE